MKYVSTRGGQSATGAQALVPGLSGDGGLFVPESFPPVNADELALMAREPYEARAVRILSRFLTDFSEEQLAGMSEQIAAMTGLLSKSLGKKKEE